mgnify:CR=1 FL=1
MSEAEKFLRDKSIGFYVDNPFYHIGIAVKFKDVIEVMEQYHQSQVNNVVSDAVIKCLCNHPLKDLFPSELMSRKCDDCGGVL